MVQAYILFGIRVLSAILLLLFLGLLTWLAYQDLKASTRIAAERWRTYGYLRVIDSKCDSLAPGMLLPLLPVTTIGRGLESAIMLDDHYVSNEHAILTFRANQWWLEDLDSRNGTLLNDVPLTGPAVLSAGDVIDIGDTRLKLEPVPLQQPRSLISEGNTSDVR